MGAGANARILVHRFQTNERRPISLGERGALAHEAANEVLLLRYHFAHAEIVRRGLAVELRARGVTFLDAHHTERLGAVGGDAVVGACRQNRADHGVAEPRRDADLVSELAGERETIETRLRPAADRE